MVKAVKGENLEWGTSSSPLVTDKHVFVQAAIGEGVPVAVAIDKATAPSPGSPRRAAWPPPTASFPRPATPT